MENFQLNLPVHWFGSSLLSKQSAVPSQNFDADMHVPFAHFHSEILHNDISDLVAAAAYSPISARKSAATKLLPSIRR